MVMKKIEAWWERRNPYIDKVIDFNNLDNVQTTVLKKRIALFNGLIRIFIHPFYEENHESICWQEKNAYPRVEFPSKGLTRILSLPSNKTPPVIVFEELCNLLKTKVRLSQMNSKSDNEVYLLSTYPDQSVPNLLAEQQQSIDDKINWWNLISTFRNLDVKKIIIGGQRLIVQPGYDHTNSKNFKYETRRCVGGAIKNLGRNFQIEVSTLTHPHSRFDIENVGPDYEGLNNTLLPIDYF